MQSGNSQLVAPPIKHLVPFCVALPFFSVTTPPFLFIMDRGRPRSLYRWRIVLSAIQVSISCPSLTPHSPFRSTSAERQIAASWAFLYWPDCHVTNGRMRTPLLYIWVSFSFFCNLVWYTTSSSWRTLSSEIPSLLVAEVLCSWESQLTNPKPWYRLVKDHHPLLRPLGRRNLATPEGHAGCHDCGQLK